MSATELLKKFDELGVAMKAHLDKVNPQLIGDLIFRQKRERKDPIYTLEDFIKPNQNTEQIRNGIMDTIDTTPTIYDSGTPIVVAHKINFDLLEMLNDNEFVEKMRGTYIGCMASIGPSSERR